MITIMIICEIIYEIYEIIENQIEYTGEIENYVEKEYIQQEYDIEIINLLEESNS